MVANIRGYTPNYAFKLVNFDTPRWHTLEYANWTQLDGMLLQAGIPQIRGEWAYSTLYFVGDRVYDIVNGLLYRCLVEHTSAASGTFEADRLAHPTYWVVQTLGVPVFRGQWQVNTTYSLGEIVFINAYQYYLCTTSHKSTSTFDGTKWALVFDATAAVNSTNASATAAAGSASQAATSASNAATSATNAQASAVESAAQAQKLFGTSTSSNTIGLTAKTFITQADKYFNVGKFVMIRADLDPINNWMWGQVSSYTGTTLVVNSIVSNGAGTFVSWIIDVSGSRGAIGPQGIQGELGPPLVIKGTVPSAGALPPTGNTIGDMWIATDNGHLYVWDGTQWDDAGPLGTSTTTTADIPPSNPKDGDMWWESDSGIFWVYYDDGNTSQWVQAGGAAASINQNFVLKTGDTMTGMLTLAHPTSNTVIAMNTPVGVFGNYIAAQKGGVPRWNITPGSFDTEAGSNSGSSFVITRFADNGNNLGDALSINRATGATTLTGDLTISKSSASGIITINGAAIAGGGSGIGFQTGGAYKFGIGAHSAITGGGTSDDFIVYSYAVGAPSAIRVAHTTGNVNIGTVTASTSPTTGALTVAGGLGVGGAINAAGDLKIDKTTPTITLNKPAAGQNIDIIGQTAGANRWTVRLGDGTPETGGDAGSLFAIYRWNDAGTVAAGLLAANRINGNITIYSTSPSTSPTTGALTVAGGLGVGINLVVQPAGTVLNPFSGASVNVAFPAGNPGIAFRPVNDTSQWSAVFANAAGSTVGTINTNATATAYTTSSDAALKEDLKSFDAGNIIDNTKVYDFAWKSTKERAFGVIAQQAYEVYPQAVTHTEASKEKGAERDEWWGIDYSKYVPVLLQELKALRQRVAELEGRIIEKPSTTPRGRK